MSVGSQRRGNPSPAGRVRFTITYPNPAIAATGRTVAGGGRGERGFKHLLSLNGTRISSVPRLETKTKAVGAVRPSMFQQSKVGHAAASFRYHGDDSGVGDVG